MSPIPARATAAIGGRNFDLIARVTRDRGDASAGWIEIAIDDVECGRAETALFMRMISSVGSSVGYDHGSAVSPRYSAPFRFSPASFTRS